MTTKQTKKVAKHIIEDRHGADYYKDTQLLADYLGNALSISPKKAKEKAEVIQQDRQGANYYADVEILGGYLGS